MFVKKGKKERMNLWMIIILMMNEVVNSR
jgi:hypothetical protein